jgi:hypothetical protein
MSVICLAMPYCPLDLYGMNDDSAVSNGLNAKGNVSAQSKLYPPLKFS